jgi:hypothetical protein
MCPSHYSKETQVNQLNITRVFQALPPRILSAKVHIMTEVKVIIGGQGYVAKGMSSRTGDELGPLFLPSLKSLLFLWCFYSTLHISPAFILLMYIKCTKGLHCDIPIYVYNVLLLPES